MPDMDAYNEGLEAAANMAAVIASRLPEKAAATANVLNYLAAQILGLRQQGSAVSIGTTVAIPARFDVRAADVA